MKLIIQIPCLDEEANLPATLAELPAAIDGIDQIEVLVIDDGSTDATIDVARQHGVQHIYRHRTNRGLGRAFRSGLDQSLKLGADIIVNTDGDGQYCGADIPSLVAPVLEGRADIAIGDRDTASIKEFSWSKKCLQRMGSAVVRSLSGIEVPDAVSGFRAISRPAAMRMNILSKFSYSVEMLIQAGNKDMAVVSVPVRVNPKARESRLFGSTTEFVSKQLAAMLRMYAMYRPLRFFLYLGTAIGLVGLLPLAVYLLQYVSSTGGGQTHYLLIGGTLVVMAFIVFVTGLLSDLISQNRQLSEITLEKMREMELASLTSDEKSRDPGPDAEP